MPPPAGKPSPERRQGMVLPIRQFDDPQLIREFQEAVQRGEESVRAVAKKAKR